MCNIFGAKNYLADQGWRFPTGAAGADKAENGAESTDWSGNGYTMAQVFAYGAHCPAFDANQLIDDADNFIAQAMN